MSQATTTDLFMGASPALGVHRLGRALIALIAVTSVFQAIAVGIGQAWYPPQLFLQLGLMLLLMIEFICAPHVTVPKQMYAETQTLLLFLLLAVLSALILPRIFAGTYILFPSGGLDEEITSPTRLAPTRGHIGQSLFLLLNVAMVFACVIFQNRGFPSRLLRAWLIGGLLSLFFAYYQKLSLLTGWYFPADFLYSNKGYSIGYGQLLDGYERVNATFTEPSCAGNVFGAYLAYHAFEYRSQAQPRDATLALLYLGAIVLTTSTVGYLEVLVTGALMVMSRMRRPLMALFWLLCAGLVLMATYWLLPELVASVLLNKAASGSFLNRTASDLFSIDLVVQTHFLGVGFGSNRPSSFLTYLLSNVGVLGLMLFVFYIRQLLRSDAQELRFTGRMRSLSAALLVFLAGKVLGVPDLNVWFLWIMVGLIACWKSQSIPEPMPSASA